MLPRTNNVPVGPGRVFSVFNWGLMGYDYYRSASASSDQGLWLVRPPASSRPPVHKELGDPVENALRILPKDAAFFGRGRQAIGEIATTHDALKDRTPPGLGLGDVQSSLPTAPFHSTMACSPCKKVAVGLVALAVGLWFLRR